MIALLDWLCILLRLGAVVVRFVAGVW